MRFELIIVQIQQQLNSFNLPSQDQLLSDQLKNQEVFDGIVWTQHNSQFPARAFHTSVVFNSRIFIIGGQDGTNYLNDVYSCDFSNIDSQYQTYLQLTTNAAFEPRAYHASVVFNSKIQVVGGSDDHSLYRDVWSSTDGITWTMETQIDNMQRVKGHKLIVYNGYMWLIGGVNEYNEVQRTFWQTSDGTNWNRNETIKNEWYKQHNTLFLFNNYIFSIGGRDETHKLTNDICFITDSVLSKTNNNTFMTFSDQVYDTSSSSFVPDSNEIQNKFEPIEFHTTVVSNSTIQVIGGITAEGISNKVLSADADTNNLKTRQYNLSSFRRTMDFLQWKNEDVSPTFGPVQGHTAHVFSNQIFIIGGIGNQGYKNSVFSCLNCIKTDTSTSDPWTNQQEDIQRYSYQIQWGFLAVVLIQWFIRHICGNFRWFYYMSNICIKKKTHLKDPEDAMPVSNQIDLDSENKDEIKIVKGDKSKSSEEETDIEQSSENINVNNATNDQKINSNVEQVNSN